MLTVSWIEFLVIGVYLFFLLGIGLAFRNLNDNIDDYFRSGCQGTWWLVGMSSFMAGAGSGTFVGTAWTAYEHGLTSYSLMIAATLGPLIHALFLAKCFRRLRLITGPEVVRDRYGVGLQQFYAYSGVALALWGSAVNLWAVTLFCSSMFGLPPEPSVIAIGLVVLFYSTVGGKWAVMGTDFIQGLILVPITFLAGGLCLYKMGGIGGMLDLIEMKELTEAWKPVKDAGQVEGGSFAWPFIIAFGFVLTTHSLQLGAAQKYFSAKDDRAAVSSAWVFVVLYLLGGIMWSFPAFAGRLLFENQVLASDLARPGEGAFAIASREVLPLGLSGLMMTAILAAAMSTLDSGINANAAQIVRDIYPRICSVFKWKPLQGRALLTMSKWVSGILGILIIAIAYVLCSQEKIGFFDVLIHFTAIFGMPMVIPLMMGLFVWRTPPWAGFFSLGMAAVPSLLNYTVIPWLMSFEDVALFENLRKMYYHELVFTIFGVGVAAHLVTMFWYKNASEDYKRRVSEMHERMRTPVDFEKEVGESRDRSQLIVMGWFSLAVAAFIGSLMLIPNPFTDRLQILGMALFVGLVAALLLWSGKRAAKPEAKQKAAHHPPVEGGPDTEVAPR